MAVELAWQSHRRLVGFTPASGKLQNVDVSDLVKTHFDYIDGLQLS
ncbi:hypothetical protein [Microbacterium sp. BF1]|nr:hypothetical protein [Microbacterium sp. BF1]